MAASSGNPTISDVPSVPDPLVANRSDPLEGLPYDGGTAKSHHKFQAHGVYKPPHMRILSESTASATELDPMVDSTATVRSSHGPSLDHEWKGASRPRTPHTGSAPAVATFGFDEMRKKIHEELLNVRKAAEEMEMIRKGFLEDEARFKHHVRVLRDAGLTDEEIRVFMDRAPPRFPSRPPTVQPLDVNNTTVDLAHINLAHEKKSAQQTGEELANKTPIPGGPIYSSINHPRGVHLTGKYGNYDPPMGPATNAHQDTFMRQTTSWNEQAHPYPEVVRFRGSISSGTFQVPHQIYQAAPRMRFNRSVDSLPPRFRQQQQPICHQPTPLYGQNTFQSRPKDPVPVGHPVLWPPVLNRPQSTIPNHTFRPASIPPPPPRPYRYEVDLVFDFEGVALSSNCNRDVFVKTYWKKNGFSPSQGAWAAWASVVEKAKRAEQYELQKAVERETRERYGAGSRLTKWASKSLLDLPASELGYSSSSDASTKVASSRTSEAGDEGSMAVNVVLPDRKFEIERPRARKWWKDVADKTWAFGEPPRPDDAEYYMTHVVEKPGWQVRDVQPE